jgi:predicted ATPase
MSPRLSERFLRSVYLVDSKIPDANKYPFSIPAIKTMGQLDLDAAVTIFVGDNGSGKSTLVEAIAIAAGFNAEGGSRNFNFKTRGSESELHTCLRLARGVRRPRDGFFLRAESLFNVATEIENLGVGPSYGDRSLHEQSHGESFMALAENRFGSNGLYVLDEPEAALSPQRQLSFLAIIHQLATNGSQLVMATHSPILMAYPDAVIYRLDGAGIARVAYEDTEHYQITRSFLTNREIYLRKLFEPE